MAKNAADTTYAIGDAKYVRISLIAITEMKRNVYSSKFSSVVNSRKISSSVIGRGVRFVRPHPFSIIDFAICSDACTFGLASTMNGLKSSLSDLWTTEALRSERASITDEISRMELMNSGASAPRTLISIRSACWSFLTGHLAYRKLRFGHH